MVWRSGSCAVAVEQDGPLVTAALVLDDRDPVLDADSWRQWLRLSNALALRDWPTVVTTTTLGATAASAATAAPDAPSTLDEEWALVYESASPGFERDLVLALADAGAPVSPTIGAEGPDGIMIDVSWPTLRIVVGTEAMPAQDRADLEAAGWVVVPPDAATIIEQLSRAGAGRDGEA